MAVSSWWSLFFFASLRVQVMRPVPLEAFAFFSRLLAVSLRPRIAREMDGVFALRPSLEVETEDHLSHTDQNFPTDSRASVLSELHSSSASPPLFKGNVAGCTGIHETTTRIATADERWAPSGI